MRSRSHGGAASAALAGVSIAAGLALGRIYDDDSFAMPVVVAAVLPHVIGLAGRRRGSRPELVLVLTVIAFVVAAAWLLVPATTVYGIPGPATVTALAHRLHDGWHVFRVGRAPVAVSDGVVLLAMCATAAAATTADLLAFRAEATIGAIAPALVVFVFASTLGTTELRTLTTLAFAAAVVVFLLVQHQVLLEARRAWATGRRPGPSGVASVGAAVGGLAIVTGLLLGPALPGAGDPPLVAYRGLGGAGAAGPGDYRTLSPLVDLRARLTDQPDQALFTVKAPVRLYWRIAALDDFDGRVWGIRSRARPASEILGRGHNGRDVVTQQFDIGVLDAQWLPAAYEPVGIDLADARVVVESRTLIAGRREITGLTYTVRSRVPARPGPREIAATVGPVPASLRRTLQQARRLPAGFPARVRRLAQQIVTGAATPYDAAKRLEAFFLDGSFSYDLDTPRGSGTDAITAFLVARQGFCEQFAGTFAAMARAAGLPARVAVGFTPGDFDSSSGLFTVKARDAHAWPEVWLRGLGWTAFEPTPADPQAGAADPTVGQPAAGTTPGSPTSASSTTPTTGSTPAPSRALPRSDTAVAAGASSRRGGTGGLPRSVVLAVVGVLAASAAGAVALRRVVARWRRRVRRRHALRPADAVAGAWQDALERLQTVGLRPAPALTPREQVGVVAAGTPLPARDGLERPLRDLAELYTRCAWSPTGASPDDVVRAWRDADALRRAISETTTIPDRIRRGVLSRA